MKKILVLTLCAAFVYSVANATGLSDAKVADMTQAAIAMEQAQSQAAQLAQWKASQSEHITPVASSVVVEKWQVKFEVQKREHARVDDVQIVAPGVAKARFAGGVADVHFGFRDPVANCPIGQDRECERRMQDNPLGFVVLSYESHRN